MGETGAGALGLRGRWRGIRMSTVLVELTEEERVALCDLCRGARLRGSTLSAAAREAIRKLRDAEPNEKERVR